MEPCQALVHLITGLRLYNLKHKEARESEQTGPARTPACTWYLEEGPHLSQAFPGSRPAAVRCFSATGPAVRNLPFGITIPPQQPPNLPKNSIGKSTFVGHP